jgi:hypothetical protein
MLMIAGGVAAPLIRFCSAIKPPNVVRESWQDASSTIALGAAALAHSTLVQNTKILRKCKKMVVFPVSGFLK